LRIISIIRGTVDTKVAADEGKKPRALHICYVLCPFEFTWHEPAEENPTKLLLFLFFLSFLKKTGNKTKQRNTQSSLWLSFLSYTDDKKEVKPAAKNGCLLLLGGSRC
jgi:hypothetical protein